MNIVDEKRNTLKWGLSAFYHKYLKVYRLNLQTVMVIADQF